MNHRSPRRLPLWTWILASLIPPAGLFIACGAARLLSWWRAVGYALLSFASIYGFVTLMAHLDQIKASPLSRCLAVLAGTVLYGAWGMLLFRIGQDVRYWTPAVEHGWRLAGKVALAMFGLFVAATGFQFFAVQVLAARP